LDRKDFQLDVLYEEPSLGKKDTYHLTGGQQFKGQPLLSLLNLDR
jgi:hypothetical protein